MTCTILESFGGISYGPVRSWGVSPEFLVQPLLVEKSQESMSKEHASVSVGPGVGTTVGISVVVGILVGCDVGWIEYTSISSIAMSPL